MSDKNETKFSFKNIKEELSEVDVAMTISTENDTGLQTNRNVKLPRKKRHKNVILIGIGITMISIVLIGGIVLGVSLRNDKKDLDSKKVRQDHRTVQGRLC